MGAKRRFGEGHADTEREVRIDLQRGPEDRGLQFGDDGVMSPAELAAELGCCPHCGVEPDERHMPSCPTRRR